MTAPDQANETGRASPSEPSVDALCIDTIRTLSMDAVQHAKSGHPGAPMVYTLWQCYLRFDLDEPSWPNRDRFMLSNGHASMLLHALLHLAGVKEANGVPAVAVDDIRHFRQIDSRFHGFPSNRYLITSMSPKKRPLPQGERATP